MNVEINISQEEMKILKELVDISDENNPDEISNAIHKIIKMADIYM